MRVWLSCSVLCLGLIPACGGSGEGDGSGAPNDAAAGGSGGGFVDGGGWLDSSAGGSGGGAGSSAGTCDDTEQNGDETGVDCGGSCPPCGLGLGCDGPEDCLSFLCVDNQCCTASTYELTTGLVSGTADVCCNGSDERLSVEDCGEGNAHSADAVEPNCAHAAEGAENGGSCCAKITCQKANCGS